MQGAFAEHPNLDEDKSELDAVCASTDFDEFNVAKENDMSDLLLDIAWLLKEPTKDYSETCSGSLNIKRLCRILHFSMQNNLISVLKAITKYVDNMIQKSEFLTADAYFELFQEYMKIAREMLSRNTLRKERTKLDSGHTDFLKILQTWHMANTGKLVNTQNQVEERNNTYSQEMLESAPLVINGITRSKMRFLRLNHHWPCKYWAGELFFHQVTTTWPAIFVTATLIMCFVVCIILLNPQKVSDVAVHIKRFLPSRLT
ncbi:hypothetical protein HPP92_006948 [Vanilla planifolia]|uniref:Uncharacterized protein n=1 Tax=Vanilla planifolia TaxID=51239 RepID=A0A835V7C1_VANPL|nr:hypothetical protein HPP92_006948 [Vanilla planifolia]